MSNKVANRVKRVWAFFCLLKKRKLVWLLPFLIATGVLVKQNITLVNASYGSANTHLNKTNYPLGKNVVSQDEGQNISQYLASNTTVVKKRLLLDNGRNKARSTYRTPERGTNGHVNSKSTANDDAQDSSKGISDETGHQESGTVYHLVPTVGDICVSPVEIMPLGDSITKGSGSPSTTGYRQPLYLWLTDAGYDVDFVGRLKHGLSASPSFDVDHEGHSGIRDDEVASNVFSWLQTNPADIVLLHIGTNDMDPDTLDTGTEDVEAILDEIDSYSPDITVVLALIINRDIYSPETHQFNIDITAMAEARMANGDKIIMVDQESALTYPDDLSDDVHPNVTGYEKMADVWFEALDTLLSSCFTPTPPLITSTPVTQTVVGQVYSYNVNATGYPAPTYTLTTSPSGMSINATTGVIAWTPTDAGDFHVTVEASNDLGIDSQNFNVIVSLVPTIVSTPVTAGIVGQTYSYDVDATGSPAPVYSLATAPSGMSINATTGVISWTPTAAGTFHVTVEASNDAGSGSQSFAITVSQAPLITSTPVTAAVVGQLYSYDVNATGSPAPVYSLATAPSGMSINATTGVIAWTPTDAGDFHVTVEASNDAGIDSQDFNIIVSLAPTITSTPVTAGIVGQPYSYDVNATGSPTLVYSLVTAPSGMSINATTGVISWTPVTNGDFDVTVEASNDVGSDSQSFTISVSQVPVITSMPVTAGIVGQPYSYDVDATGSPAPVYSLVTAPSGMSINATTGVISWTPTAAGSFNVAVQAINLADTDNQSFTISVSQVPVITSTPVSSATLGQVYSYNVNATGSPAPTYTLLTAPLGMTINATTGVISWTPTAAGSFDVAVQASNVVGSDTQSFTIEVPSKFFTYLPVILKP
jgi:lysophospholipase L1-like esterase